MIETVKYRNVEINLITIKNKETKGMLEETGDGDIVIHRTHPCTLRRVLIMAEYVVQPNQRGDTLVIVKKPKKRNILALEAEGFAKVKSSGKFVEKFDPETTWVLRFKNIRDAQHYNRIISQVLLNTAITWIEKRK